MSKKTKVTTTSAKQTSRQPDLLGFELKLLQQDITKTVVISAALVGLLLVLAWQL